jgi:lysophospholipase L1-like esterase
LWPIEFKAETKSLKDLPESIEKERRQMMNRRPSLRNCVVKIFHMVCCLVLFLALFRFSYTGYAGAAEGIDPVSGTIAVDLEKAPYVVTPEELAEYYFPQEIWFHPLEFCAWPATRRTPGVAVYRVRPHPNDPDMLAITYSMLYRNDCGGLLGMDKHPGDVESFSYTLASDSACTTGWRLFSVKTTAHGAEPGNVAVRIMNSCEPLPELFVSLKKHGTYMSMERCNAYIDPTQGCEQGFAPDFILVNAGSPDNSLADDLSAYFPSERLAPMEYIWSGDGRFCGGQWVEDRTECVGAPGLKLTDDSLLAPVHQPALALIGLGDSLTHGTMDATNNKVNTLNAYLQKVADSLGQVVPLRLNQPFFDEAENRMPPYEVPTNLGVDGSDLFSLEGLEYYKRVGAEESFFSTDLLCDKWLPQRLRDKYDKVLYPINVLNWRPVSQLDSAVWLLNEGLAFDGIDKALVILWIGNNDSSEAALGAGGKNPEFQPLPFDLIKKELNPLLSLLLGSGQAKGLVSFEPYTLAAIERNLTELNDFAEQYIHVLDRMATETGSSGVSYDVLALTLPYYSAVGYLMDSEDIEFYLRKVRPWYTVPASFKRVAPRGEPITDFLKGDRISLVTFGMMYALLSTGHSVAEVNKVLEEDGQQRDGLVLSEAKQEYIMARIEGFNDAIRAAVAASSPKVHLVDIGKYLNDVFLGKEVIEVDGRVFNRKWIRGGGFCFDGVHPGYTGQALIANFILERINETLGLNAPLQDLSEILATDPYIDRDGDGWAVGPDYEGSGFTKLLYLFKDPDDSSALVQPVMPPNLWKIISEVLLGEILDIPAMRASAESLGLIPLQSDRVFEP